MNTKQKEDYSEKSNYTQPLHSGYRLSENDN